MHSQHHYPLCRFYPKQWIIFILTGRKFQIFCLNLNLIAVNLNRKLKAAPVRSTLLHHQELRSDQKMPADSINHRTAPPGEELPGEISRDPQTVRNAVCDLSHYPAAVIHKICGQLCGKQRKNYPGCSSELGLHRCQALLGFLFLYVKSNTYTTQTVTTTS